MSVQVELRRNDSGAMVVFFRDLPFGDLYELQGALVPVPESEETEEDAAGSI